MLPAADPTSTSAQLRSLLRAVRPRPVAKTSDAAPPPPPASPHVLPRLRPAGRPALAVEGGGMKPWLVRPSQLAPSFDAAFRRVLGPAAVDELKRSINDVPVVLIAGDQLTGKSTAAKAVAAALGGEPSGSGAVVRKIAEERGLTIEEMSRALAAEPDTDVRIDHRAASIIARGEAAAFESRLAGQLGRYLRSLGKDDVVSIYLECAPKERALRYVGREIGEDARARLEPLLQVAEGADLEECLEALGRIDDPAAQQVAARFSEIASRDDNDHKRLKALYGVDYTDRSVFDVVVDTTGKAPDDVQREIMSAVEALLARRSAS